jgi:hypothetical protein
MKGDILEEFMAQVQHGIDEYIKGIGCDMKDADSIREFCIEHKVEITYDTEFMYIVHNGKIVRRFQQPFSDQL